MLPDGVEAITGADRTAQDIDDLGADFLDAFKSFLVVFAGIAMLVAAFSIHNTFSILVAQRTRESALLRTIGASRRQILTWVTIEALALGAIASIAGLFGGLGLAQLLKAHARRVRVRPARGRHRVRGLDRVHLGDHGHGRHAAGRRGTGVEGITRRAARGAAGDERRPHERIAGAGRRGRGAAVRRHRASC